MQITFKDKTVKYNAVEDIKDFNSQHLLTKTKKENN